MFLTITNDNIEIYFKEIRNYSSLTRDEEITLFARIARGDKSAETIVFNKMAKLAVAVAKTYTGNPDLLEDLIQEANMGVLTAIKKFDPALGYRFSSYARWWMKANITAFLNSIGIVHANNPKIPDLVKKIRREFFSLNGRDITEYELLDKIEEMGEVVNDINTLLGVSVTRIDSFVDSDEDITMGECGEFAERTSSKNGYEVQMEEESLSNDIIKLLSKLTPREQMIIRMKFGFVTGYEMDYKGIAEMWNKESGDNLTVERVRQIVVAALKKMK